MNSLEPCGLFLCTKHFLGYNGKDFDGTIASLWWDDRIILCDATVEWEVTTLSGGHHHPINGGPHSTVAPHKTVRLSYQNLSWLQHLITHVWSRLLWDRQSQPQNFPIEKYLTRRRTRPSGVDNHHFCHLNEQKQHQP